MSRQPCHVWCYIRPCETRGRCFHSTKNSEIFETGTNGPKISWKRFKKIRKLTNFQKRNHSKENSWNSKIKIEWNRKCPGNVFRKFGYTTGGCPVFQKLSGAIIDYGSWNYMQIYNFLFGGYSFYRDHHDYPIQSWRRHVFENILLATSLSINTS